MTKPQISTLKNGLTVITQHRPGEQVYANVTVNVGYRHERPDQDNMAHFLEHLANLGKFKDKRERQKYLQERRGTTNASTNSQRTDYHLQLNKAYAEEAVEMLAGRMLNFRFDSDFVEAERGSVETELRSKVNSPDLINYQRVIQTAFPDTQLDKDRFETVDTVKNHTAEQLEEFKEIHYTADNMALAVVGDVKHEDIVAWAEKHFDGLKTSPDLHRAKHPAAAYRGGMKTHITPEAPEVKIAFGFESKGRKDPLAASIDQLLAQILGEGKSSKLYKALIGDKQLAREVESDCDSYNDNGIFLIDAATSPDKVREAIEAIAQESKKLASSITQEDLDRSKNQLIGDIERSDEQISRVGQNLAFIGAVDGQLYDAEQDLAILKSITLEQLQARAKTLFDSAPSISIHGSDLSQLPSYEEISAAFGKARHLDEKGLVVQSKQEQSAAMERALAAGEPPFAAPSGTPAPEEAEAATQSSSAPQTTVLENGLRIITQKAPAKQIYAKLEIGSGSRHETPEQKNISAVLATASADASTRLSRDEKTARIANMRGQTEVSPAMEVTSFGVRAANEFTADALHILSENVTSPRLDEESVERQKALVKKQILSKKQDAQLNTSRQTRRLAFPGSSLDADPVANADRLDDYTLADIQAFRDQHYTADNMTLTVVGDVEHADIVALAKQHYAGLKAHPDTPRPALDEPKYRGGYETRSNKASDQVTLQFGFKGSNADAPKTNAVDNLLGNILAGDFASRLMMRLRSKEGLVYGAGANNVAFEGAGLFTIATATHQDNLQQLVTSLTEEVTRFAESVTQEELDNVKSSYMGAVERAQASAKSIGNTLQYDDKTGEIKTIQDKLRHVESVTLDDIKTRAREIFSSAPSIAAFGNGVEKLPSYEEITEKFGKRRSLDSSGLVVQDVPSADRNIKGASISAQAATEKQQAIG